MSNKGPTLLTKAPPNSGPKLSETNQPKRDLEGPPGIEPTSANQIYIGESSGTKDEELESTPCDEDGNLESEPEESTPNGLSVSDTTEIVEELLHEVQCYNSHDASSRPDPVEPT